MSVGDTTMRWWLNRIGCHFLGHDDGEEETSGLVWCQRCGELAPDWAQAVQGENLRQAKLRWVTEGFAFQREVEGLLDQSLALARAMREIAAALKTVVRQTED
jgi:hypothetical protein